MSKNTSNNNNAGNNEVKFTNEIFSNITMKEVAKIGVWSVEEIDELFKVAHHKPQLNTLNKQLKVTLTTLYLCLPYESKIKSCYSERIRRFKWDHKIFWSKELKAFTCDEFQAIYLSLKNEKEELLEKVNKCKKDTLNRIKSALLFQTYGVYRELQAHKNKDDYNDYKSLYKVAIAQYLSSNGVKPSIKLIDFLCDDTNILGVNKNINAEDANVKIASSYEKYVLNFTYSMVQALIDYNVINVESYLNNELFVESLDNIDVQDDLRLLQEIAQIDDYND